jgi:hypothetical protein
LHNLCCRHVGISRDVILRIKVNVRLAWVVNRPIITTDSADAGVTAVVPLVKPRRQSALTSIQRIRPL